MSANVGKQNIVNARLLNYKQCKASKVRMFFSYVPIILKPGISKLSQNI